MICCWHYQAHDRPKEACALVYALHGTNDGGLYPHCAECLKHHTEDTPLYALPTLLPPPEPTCAERLAEILGELDREVGASPPSRFQREMQCIIEMERRITALEKG